MCATVPACGRSILVVCVLLAPAAFAEWTPQWTTTFPAGDSLSLNLAGMVVDAAGVTYLTGTVDGPYYTDVLTAAVEPDGKVRWSQIWNGPSDWHDQARWITLGADGAVYVTGNTPGEMTFANVILLKYDAVSGALLRSVQYSSGFGISEHGASVAVAADGSVYIVGGTVGDGGDALTVKLDASGKLVWKQVWDGPAWGPYSQDSAWQVELDRAGNPIVMIHGVMNSNHPDYVLIKYAAADGAVLWETNWGVNGGDFPQEMALDAAFDVYVTGTGINFRDQYSTIKLDGDDGQLVWQFYDTAGFDDYAAGIALDRSSGVYVTGTVDPDGDPNNFNDNFYSVKRDQTTGALRWTHSYGENCRYCYDVASDVVAEPAGKVYITGTTSSPPYSADMIVFALDAQTGAEVERGLLSGSATETSTGRFVRLDGAANVYIGGQFYDVNSGQVVFYVTRFPSLSGLRGDLNCDGAVNFGDINPFVLALGDPEEYRRQFPDCEILNGDCNGDGRVDFGDINPFVLLLGGQ